MYAAGQGVDPMFDGGYYDGTDVPGVNMCHRSSLAYGPRLAETLQSAGQIAAGAWLMPACSGDVVQHVYGGSGQDHVPNPVPQLDSLSADTRYVTLTIGGNDIGFGDIGEACFEVLGGGFASWVPFVNSLAGCWAKLYDAYDMSKPGGALSRRLLHLYRTILQRAPNARLVVVTYPRVLPTNANYTGAIASGRRYCVIGGSANAGFGFRAGVVSASDPDNRVVGINQVEAALNKVIVDTVNHVRTADGLPGRISVARLDVGEVATHPYALW